MAVGKAYYKKYGIKSGGVGGSFKVPARRSPDKSVKHTPSNAGKGIFRNLDPSAN